MRVEGAGPQPPAQVSVLTGEKGPQPQRFGSKNHPRAPKKGPGSWAGCAPWEVHPVPAKCCPSSHRASAWCPRSRCRTTISSAEQQPPGCSHCYRQHLSLPQLVGKQRTFALVKNRVNWQLMTKICEATKPTFNWLFLRAECPAERFLCAHSLGCDAECLPPCRQ